MKKSDKHKYRPHIEELERRETPSTLPLYDMSDSILVWEQLPEWDAVAAWLAEPQPFADYASSNPADHTLIEQPSHRLGHNSLHFAGAVPVALLPSSAAKSKQEKTELSASELRGLQFLVNYSRKSIRNHERDFGGLANHEDILQQIYLEWKQEIGQINGQRGALERLFDCDSNEKKSLRRVVRRVVIREYRRQENRETADYEAVRNTPVSIHSQEAVDLQIDLDSGAGNLSRQEYAILMGRKANKTFAEIGDEMQLPPTTVHDHYSSAVRRLRDLFLAGE